MRVRAVNALSVNSSDTSVMLAVELLWPGCFLEPGHPRANGPSACSGAMIITTGLDAVEAMLWKRQSHVRIMSPVPPQASWQPVHGRPQRVAGALHPGDPGIIRSPNFDGYGGEVFRTHRRRARPERPSVAVVVRGLASAPSRPQRCGRRDRNG